MKKYYVCKECAGTGYDNYFEYQCNNCHGIGEDVHRYQMELYEEAEQRVEKKKKELKNENNV